jgi:5-methylcytosine-specific restriction endonuclease McrA
MNKRILIVQGTAVEYPRPSWVNRFVAGNTRESHPIPPEVRAAVLDRAHGGCENCGSRVPLELHHLDYNLPGPYDEWCPEGPPIFGYETPDDLLALCRECHRDKHIGPFGNFYADPNEAENERSYYRHLIDDD